ncbi:hypothetical protein [Pseudoalteromonas sp. R3]|uniref:hypothetical protein n=1 Tax=Pseudoalteromonas sp. R3 TaxID=1709477 RepID=UPI0006B50BD7|nr:hypothetical protein [Pseudoalteromonas sp. R3]
MTLTALKISHLEQLNSKIFALLSTLFSRLKIEHLIKQIGIIVLQGLDKSDQLISQNGIIQLYHTSVVIPHLMRPLFKPFSRC